MAATPQAQVPALHRRLQSGSFSALAQSAMSRMSHLFLGSVLIIACIGLCIAPLPWLGSGPFLLRMILALAFLIGGMVMIQAGSDNSLKELRFDGRQGIMYVLNRRPKRRARIVASHAYNDIGEVGITDNELAVMDLSGRVLVVLPLDGPQARLDAEAEMRTHLPFLI